jgi:hypothetical protein
MGDFLRSRMEGVLDKLVLQVIFWLVVFGAPLLLGIVLDLGGVATALAVLLVCQVVLVMLLLSIKRGVTPAPGAQGPLLQDSAGTTLYLSDRFGFRRPIPDAETAVYLSEILGYGKEAIPAVDAASLGPTGPAIRSVRRWQPIRTKEPDSSFEASRSLRLLRKSVQREPGPSVLSFHLRNDSDLPIRIDSAQLTCELDAPHGTYRGHSG